MHLRHSIDKKMIHIQRVKLAVKAIDLICVAGHLFFIMIPISRSRCQFCYFMFYIDSSCYGTPKEKSNISQTRSKYTWCCCCCCCIFDAMLHQCQLSITSFIMLSVPHLHFNPSYYSIYTLGSFCFFSLSFRQML